MNIVKKQNDIYIHINDFSLEDTLDCGQCFRFNKQQDGSFFGVVNSKCLTVYQNGHNIIFKNTSLDDFEKFWCEYFDFNTDYNQIKNIIKADDKIKLACDYAGGIRILKQDPWETLCSFIISQNNNIPRIKGIIKRLCETFGDRLDDGFSFPSAQKIASVSLEDLAVLRAGFRGKYILDAAKKVTSGEVNLEMIHTMDIQQAREMLMKICGVGPKVAECVLLFGFHRLEAFPIDVWIKKVLKYYYKDGFPEFAKSYGGIAQQYLFHYVRNCKDAIPSEYQKK